MKSFKILLFLLLLSSPAFPQEIDYNKIKLVDEIFLAMEFFNDIDEIMYNYRSQPSVRRQYKKTFNRARRKLVILNNHYKLRYGDTFNRDWKYEDWLKTIPKH